MSTELPHALAALILSGATHGWVLSQWQVPATLPLSRTPPMELRLVAVTPASTVPGAGFPPPVRPVAERPPATRPSQVQGRHPGMATLSPDAASGASHDPVPPAAAESGRAGRAVAAADPAQPVPPAARGAPAAKATPDAEASVPAPRPPSPAARPPSRSDWAQTGPRPDAGRRAPATAPAPLPDPSPTVPHVSDATPDAAPSDAATPGTAMPDAVTPDATTPDTANRDDTPQGGAPIPGSPSALLPGADSGPGSGPGLVAGAPVAGPGSTARDLVPDTPDTVAATARTAPGAGPGSTAAERPAPRAVYAPSPDYPEEARWEARTGRLVLGFLLTPEGRVGEVRLLQSSGSSEMDAAARDALRRWRFEPSPGPGRWYRQAFRFELS